MLISHFVINEKIQVQARLFGATFNNPSFKNRDLKESKVSLILKMY